MRYEHQFGQKLEAVFSKVAGNRSLLHAFLYDILSPGEYKELAVRWQIIKQLSKGVSQRDIAKSLRVSVATVTRGSRMLMNKKGGFNVALQKRF